MSSNNITSAYTRRQELTCTLSELQEFGSKILLDKELLYVLQGDGRYAVKVGDGVTQIKDLPYSINYSEINALKTAAEASETVAAQKARIATDMAKIATDVTTEVVVLGETKKTEITAFTKDKKQEIENKGTEVLATIPEDYHKIAESMLWFDDNGILNIGGLK